MIARTESRVPDRPFRIFVPRISPAWPATALRCTRALLAGSKGRIAGPAYSNYVRQFKESDWRGSTMLASYLITCQTLDPVLFVHFCDCSRPWHHESSGSNFSKSLRFSESRDRSLGWRGSCCDFRLGYLSFDTTW